MDILKDMKELIKGDKEHAISVTVDSCGVTVELDYDPEYGKCMIPVHYDALEGWCYIPQDELIEKYKPGDYGIDLKEIVLIQRIMEYLEDNKDEINMLCKYYDIDGHRETEVEE